MSDLVEFLNARLEEDEISWSMNHGPLRARMDREVEAKRRILAEHAPVSGPLCQTCPDVERSRGYSVIQIWPCLTVRALAAVYSGHPDYDPAWKCD